MVALPPPPPPPLPAPELPPVGTVVNFRLMPVPSHLISLCIANYTFCTNTDYFEGHSSTESDAATRSNAPKDACQDVVCARTMSLTEPSPIRSVVARRMAEERRGEERRGEERRGGLWQDPSPDQHVGRRMSIYTKKTSPNKNFWKKHTTRDAHRAGAEAAKRCLLRLLEIWWINLRREHATQSN